MLITTLAAMIAVHQDAVSRDAFVRAVDARFVGIDANGNGQLDESELDAAQARIVARIQARRQRVATANFAAADADADGKVTLDEWLAAATAAPLRVWTGGQLLGSLDADRDGTVSIDEYRASQLDQFDARDADGDGTIEAGER